MQIVGAELEAITGEPDAIKEVAHAQIVHAEPDLKLGELGESNANAPAHLEGAKTESLVHIEDHGSLEKEGTTGKKASVEKDRDPRGQPPYHAGRSRVPHLVTIAITHHPGGC